MPAPKDNTNARKGKINRRMWSQRLPVDIIKIIKTRSNYQEISQSDSVTIAIQQYDEKYSQDVNVNEDK